MGSKEYNRKWYLEHKDKWKLYQKNTAKRLKEELYQLLGNKCVICGYSGVALQIDHINSDGYIDRKLAGSRGGLNLYYVIRKKIREGSKGYQLLCANCNWEKKFRLNENRKFTT